MKGVNAALGWMLMLVVLAVPSFLFYNWWTKNKAPAAEAAPAAVSQEAFPSREGGVTDAVGPSPRAAQAAQPPAVSTAAAQQPLKPAALVAGPAVQDLPVKPAVLVPVAQPQAAPQAQNGGQSPQAKPGTGYNPKGTRNPMLSLEDFRRIREEQLARAEEERAARMGVSRRKAEPGLESRIRLQGIVGNAAIINGDMYYAGQNIYGGKITKIGADYIIVEYRGKKIRKSIQ